MEDLEKKLKALKELLEKGMNNSGLGGPGSVKAGAVLPSISTLPKPGNNSLAGKVKIPNVASATKKNPIKSAEQTQNKDIKDIRMKEAHAQMAMQKDEGKDLYHIKQDGIKITSQPIYLKEIETRHGGVKKLESSGFKVVPHVATERITFKKNGQWHLEEMDKSGYKGYTPEDNVKRKANNTSETTGIHSMNSIKSYGGSGPNAADREAKEMRSKSKKNPVREYSQEEIAEMNKPKETTEKTEGRTTAVSGVSDMGIEVRRSNPANKEYAKVSTPAQHSETAKQIASNNVKQTKEIKPKLPK